VWVPEMILAAAKDADLTIVETPSNSEFLASRQEIGDSGDEFWA